MTDKKDEPRPLAIDIHAHLLVPEVYAVTAAHSLFHKMIANSSGSEEVRRKNRERAEWVIAQMSDLSERRAHMDKMGVDIQVLSSSLVHQCTYWAAPSESLRLEQSFNDHTARAVADGKGRFVGLCGVPLQAPALAVKELQRCMGELGLKGVGISTIVGETEIGEKSLWPFWSKVEELGAVVYIHPHGNPHPRFQKYQLWNSVGQNFEETMAIASLFYEGVLDAFPKLKICISHGGGYMPYNVGRVARNYIEKPSTRANMTKSPADYLRMLYYDTCVYDTDVLQRLVDQVGAEQVVLGSDYPVGEMKPVEFVKDAHAITDTDKERIIGLNAAKLLDLDASNLQRARHTTE